MSRKTIKKRYSKCLNWLKQNWLLILILLIGFYIRVDDVYSVHFYGDAFVLPSLEFIEEHKLPLTGTEVSGMLDNADKGPFLTYLYALPLLISKNPVSVIIFSGMLNTLGIFLCYLLVNRMFKKRTALITIALLAVNPFQIYFSRTIDVMPILFFFIILFFWSAYSLFVEKKSKYVILLLFSIGCLVQIHILASIMVITGLAYFVIYKPKINIKHLLIGILTIVILFLPFIYYELTHHFKNTLNTLKLFTLSAGISSQNASVLNIIKKFIFFNTHLDTTSLYNLQRFINPVYQTLFDIFSRIEEWLFLIGLIFIILLGIIVMIKRRDFLFLSFLRNKSEIRKLKLKSFLFLLIWLLVPVLFFILLKSELLHRYYLYLFPLQFIVIGYFLNCLIELMKKDIVRKIMKYSVFAIVLLIMLTQIIFLSHINNIVSREGVIKNSIPLKHKFELVSFLLNNLSMNEDAFATNVHTIGIGADWKGGFKTVFRYYYQKDKNVPDKKIYEHYLLMQNQTAVTLLRNGLIYNKKYNIGKFVLLEYPPQINYSSWSMTTTSIMDWFRFNLKSKNWSKIDFPFLGTREIEELFLRGIIEIRNKTNNSFLYVSSRACIERLYINENLVINKTCPRERKMIEISPIKYEIDIAKFVKTGKNLVNMKLVNIHKFFMVEIYDMAFNKSKREKYYQEEAQDILIIDDFEEANLENAHFVTSEKSEGTVSIIDDAYQGKKALLIEYTLIGKEPHALFHRSFVEFENWKEYNSINLWIRGDGKEGVFRFVIIDDDDDQWVYEDMDILQTNYWTKVSIPFKELENPEWAAHGNRKKNFDKIKSYQIHLIPLYPRTFPSEELTHKLYLDNIHLV